MSASDALPWSPTDSHTRHWLASPSEITQDMKELGQWGSPETSGRDLRKGTKARHKEGSFTRKNKAQWKARREMNELSPILGLATLLLEKESEEQKPAKRKGTHENRRPGKGGKRCKVGVGKGNWTGKGRPPVKFPGLQLSPRQFGRAATHVAIAYFIAYEFQTFGSETSSGSGHPSTSRLVQRPEA